MNTLIIQHTGATNKGSEALLRGALRLIAECAAGPTQVWSVTSQPDYDPPLFPEVRFLPRIHATPKRRRLVRGLASCPAWLTFPARWEYRARQFWQLDQAYRRADLVISIGGDMFTDHYGLEGLNNELWYVQEAVRRRKPVCLLGQSIGPLGPPSQERAAVAVLQQADLITVREPASWRFLESAGLDMRRVHLAGDLSLLMEVDPDRDSGLLSQLGRGAPRIGFNVSHSIANYAGPRGDYSRYLDACAAGIRALWQSYPEAEVCLVPHVIDRTTNDDRVACAALAERLGDRRVVLFEPSRIASATAMELKRLLSQMDVVVAARTHAALAAYTTGVPVLAVAYSLKAKGLAEYFFGGRWREHVLDVTELTGRALGDALIRLIQNRAELRAILLAKAADLKQEALRNVRLVQDLMRSRGG